MLTTSYPRYPGDAAGRFVAESVERVRERGVAVEVVSPATFGDRGVAYGGGIVQNLRARPARALLLPGFLAAFARAARREARDADLVHAHWLPSGLVAMAVRKPFVVQVWGTDVELARRTPALARAVLRRARLVIAASTALAEAARALGAREVRVVPQVVDVPHDVPEPETPPHVLYAGRLSPEKGVLELLEAAPDLPLVVAGDGPLRDRVPQAVGMVPHDELRMLYAAASVVAVPSRREGFGVVCAEAMAHGRPVVASAVGGLLDLVADGETGILVPPRDAHALREALLRLLDDGELRRRMGEAARARVRDRFSWQASTDALLEAYDDATGSPARRSPSRPSAAT